MGSALVTVRCDDIEDAIAAYADDCRLRLETIFPADGPRAAELSGPGVRLRLVSEPSPSPADGLWSLGRAGMWYRDLIPDRLDGRVIASHIRIPEGGPVADYVHHHRVAFQMIFVRRGWVRVVYEDQGPPFVMEPGDCVLQPPGIRHRVLESSDELEVIEISSPAEHETMAEHQLTLPNGTHRGRTYGDQPFVHHRRHDAGDGDLGIEAATSGLAAARTGAPVQPSGVSLWFVLDGAIVVDDVPVGCDGCLLVEPGAAVDASADANVLQVRLPA